MQYLVKIGIYEPVAMALARLQHGIKENLSSVVYLTGGKKVTNCFKVVLVTTRNGKYPIKKF